MYCPRFSTNENFHLFQEQKSGGHVLRFVRVVKIYMFGKADCTSDDARPKYNFRSANPVTEVMDAISLS